MHRKRSGYTFNIEDGEAAITLLRPISGELLINGQYVVVYEDAHGTVEVHTLTLKEVASNYCLDLRNLEDTV